MRIKNWGKFQHFKDRRPPWVKLHREILEQRDINLISDRSFRVLVSLWLLASEDEQLEGNLPPVADISWRLRIPEKQILQCLQELTPWIDTSDITPVSPRYQDDRPEAETEAETEAKKDPSKVYDFEVFWDAFKYKKGKNEAKGVWKKLKLNDDIFNAIIFGAKQEAIERVALEAKGKTPKMAQGWLSGRRWEDYEECSDGSDDDMRAAAEECISIGIPPAHNSHPRIIEIYEELKNA
jgi:hypothetical protein